MSRARSPLSFMPRAPPPNTGTTADLMPCETSLVPELGPPLRNSRMRTCMRPLMRLQPRAASSAVRTPLPWPPAAAAALARLAGFAFGSLRAPDFLDAGVAAGAAAGSVGGVDVAGFFAFGLLTVVVGAAAAPAVVAVDLVADVDLSAALPEALVVLEGFVTVLHASAGALPDVAPPDLPAALAAAFPAAPVLSPFAAVVALGFVAAVPAAPCAELAAEVLPAGVLAAGVFPVAAVPDVALTGKVAFAGDAVAAAAAPVAAFGVAVVAAGFGGEAGLPVAVTGGAALPAVSAEGAGARAAAGGFAAAEAGGADAAPAFVTGGAGGVAAVAGFAPAPDAAGTLAGGCGAAVPRTEAPAGGTTADEPEVAEGAGFAAGAAVNLAFAGGGAADLAAAGAVAGGVAGFAAALALALAASTSVSPTVGVCARAVKADSAEASTAAAVHVDTRIVHLMPVSRT